MRLEFLAVMIPIVMIVAFWAYMVVHSLAKTRVRELEIRERIAMIEKGLVPPPEVDPRGFDRAMAHYERRAGAPYRHRRAGITLVGVGLGLVVMIAFAGEAPQKAVGIGGFIVLLGLAFVVNSVLEQRQSDALNIKGDGMSAPPSPPGSPTSSTPSI